MRQAGYRRLGIEEFGAELLSSKDLDPVYCALVSDVWWQATGFENTRMRWLVAYWCLYHCGAASYLAEFEGPEFWRLLREAAANDKPAPTGGRWPRGHERRHFRGAQALRAVSQLQERYPSPEGFVHYVADLGRSGTASATCAEVMKRVQEHYLFGPWIAFKVADTVERVLDRSITFEEAEVFLFDQPREAALMLWCMRAAGPTDWQRVKPRDEAKAVHEVIEHLVKFFHLRDAPPRGDRPVGLQEVETILCKWKSHLNGHYPLRNDILEIRSGLKPWLPVSALANIFLKAMPE